MTKETPFLLSFVTDRKRFVKESLGPLFNELFLHPMKLKKIF